MASPVIQFKRGSFANLPALKAGEPGFTTDRYDFYIGLDNTAGNNKFFGSSRYWSREDGSTALEFAFVDKDGNNSINLKAPDTLAGVSTYVLPATPVAGNVLVTDADGNLSWTDNISSGITTFIVNNINISGIATIGDLFVTGVSTFQGDANFGGNIIGDGSTNISGIASVTATEFYGDGSKLTGIGGTGGALAGGDLSLRNLTVSGVGTFAGDVHGDFIIGEPTDGSYAGGAIGINTTDYIKDVIDTLNETLGLLVPSAPDTIQGASLSLTGTAGNGRLCAGFSPTNNAGAEVTPTAGTQYTRNTDSTVTTEYLTEYGPGNSGTVDAQVNGGSVGSRVMTSGNDDGTYSALQIRNNEDASNSTRNPDIDAGFYQIYDARIINAASPDGFNYAQIVQDSAESTKPVWYEDPSTVTAPALTFGSVTAPDSATDVVSYSSGIPHYTENAANAFTYTMSLANGSGDMYTQNQVVGGGSQTTGFTGGGTKNYTDFAGGTNPPARNYGVGSPVATTVSHTPRNIHGTITSNHFSTFNATTPYGTQGNTRASFVRNVNIMGTTASTSVIDEDNILVSSLGTGSGNATRVNGGSGDNPTPSYTTWVPANSIQTYDAAVRGGTLRHDVTDYSAAAYLPQGPNYSTGRNGDQYFQVEIIRSQVSEFSISYTGSAAGCWVAMPDNSTWTTSLSGTNGWADMFQAYRGSGVPTSAEPGCSSGGVMDTNGGTFTCVFGTESSSNDTNNRILVRWKLTSGQSITAMSFSAT